MTQHNPRTCPLCASLRHPSNAKQARALTKHLAQQPIPGPMSGDGR